MSGIYVGISLSLIWTLVVGGLTWEAHTWKDGFDNEKATQSRLVKIESGQQSIIDFTERWNSIRATDTKPCLIDPRALVLLNGKPK